VSDSSSNNLSKDFWKNSNALKNLGNPRQQEWEINKEISDEEISEAIFSTPNFKVCGLDGISMKFFKALITDKGDSEESSEINNMSSGFKYLKKKNLNQLYLEW